MSVVVVPFDGMEGLRRCLAGLRDQVGDSPIETIVPHDVRTRWSAELAREFPAVRFIRLEGERTPAQLRAQGIRRARMPIVALTEDHCRPVPGWTDRVLESHRLPYAAIGGTIEKRVPDKLVAWALYFLDYLRYARPQPRGATQGLSDVNVSYKRSVLERVARSWDQAFHEPVVHSALARAEETLWLEPEMIVDEGRDLDLLPALGDRLSFGRLFGATRAWNLGPGRRMVHFLGCSILPFLLVIRIFGGVSSRRRFVLPALLAFPTVALLAIAWSFGEALGYLTGRPPGPPCSDNCPAG